MSQISRGVKAAGGTTFQDGTDAYGSEVEADVSTLFNAHNNHDTGTSKWVVVSVLGATSVPVTADNSTGTQNILEAKDNGTTVFSVADGGATAITATNGGTSKALVVNNGTSTGNILELQDNGTPKLTMADGGVVTMAAQIAMGANKITGLANGTAATDAAAFGQITTGLQAITQTTGTTTTNITSDTQTNSVVAGSITPLSASSRIKVTATFTISTDTTSQGCLISLKRGASDLSGGASGFFTCGNNSDTFRGPVTLSYIDSPATTSATTYTITGTNAVNAGTCVIGTGRRWVIQLEEIV